MSDFERDHMRSELGFGGQFILPNTTEVAPIQHAEASPQQPVVARTPELVSIQDVSPEIAEIIRRKREQEGMPVPTTYATDKDFEFYVRGKDNRIIFQGDVPSSMGPQLLEKLSGSTHEPAKIPKAEQSRRSSLTKQPLAIQSPGFSDSVTVLPGDIRERATVTAVKLARAAGMILRSRSERKSNRSTIVGNIASVAVVASLGWGVGSSTEIGIPPRFDASQAFSNSFDPIKLVGRLLP